MKQVIVIVLTIILIATVFTGCNGKNKSSEGETVSLTNFYEVISEVPPARVAGQMQASTTFAGGSGTENDPYQIADASQLAYFAQVLNDEATQKDYADKHYALTSDIEWNPASEMAEAATKAPSYAWVPAATHSKFEGTLDGRSHTITGLYSILAVDPAEDSSCALGLFFYVSDAVIRNLTIADSYFYAYNICDGVGAFAGQQQDSVFENCSTLRVTVASRVSEVGGIVGNSLSTGAFRNCTTDGVVDNTEGTAYAGGIVSSISDGEIVNCVNNAVVKSSGDAAGGIVGSMSTSAEYVSWSDKPNATGKTTISGCENHGAVTSLKRCAAGITGLATGANADGVIENCCNDGEITGANDTAGIVGWATVSKNSIDSKANNQGTLFIDRCENTGAVTATDGTADGLVGRLIAKNEATFTMSNSVNRGTTRGTGQSGGVMGYIMISDNAVVRVSGCENAGTLTGDATNVGGLIGNIYVTGDCTSTIDFEKCVNSGAIESGSGLATGGLIGEFRAVDSTEISVTFTDCENTGLLTPKFETATISFAGGLAGDLQNQGKGTLTLVRCANHGAIRPEVVENQPEGDDTLCHIGGLVGNCDGKVIFQDCTQDGDVNAIPASVHYDPVCGLGEATVQ